MDVNHIGFLRSRIYVPWKARRPGRPCPSRRVPAPTIAPDVHTEGRWTAAAAGDRRSGGQDRPGCHRHGAECDLRGGFPRVSYGFRPGRGPHDPLDALIVGITSRKVNWILDAD